MNEGLVAAWHVSRKKEVMPFSDGDGSLLRQQPRPFGKAVEPLEECEDLLSFKACAVCCYAEVAARTKRWASPTTLCSFPNNLLYTKLYTVMQIDQKLADSLARLLSISKTKF